MLGREEKCSSITGSVLPPFYMYKLGFSESILGPLGVKNRAQYLINNNYIVIE